VFGILLKSTQTDRLTDKSLVGRNCEEYFGSWLRFGGVINAEN
jgi:hypothetical protein